jgi:putative Mn2+ efflux pump MntP
LQQLIKVVIKWSTSWELYINGFLVLLRVLLIVGYHVIIEPFKKKKKKKEAVASVTRDWLMSEKDCLWFSCMQSVNV